MEKNLFNKSWKGVFYTEYIAAWNMASLEGITPLFKDWLMQIEYKGERMPSEVIAEIMQLATTTRPGMVELVSNFIKDAYTVTIITEGGSEK